MRDEEKRRERSFNEVGGDLVLVVIESEMSIVRALNLNR